MLFVLIALWTIAFILWLSDLRSSVNRWLGAVAFSGGTGALAAVIDLQWLPKAEEAGLHETGLQMLYHLQAISSVFSYYSLPYCFVLFAIAYRPVQLAQPIRRLMPYLLLIPIVGCIIFTPSYTEMYPITFDVVVWWAIPYTIYGTVQVLLKRRFFTAFSAKHWMVCSAVLPPILFCTIMNYLLPSLGMLRMWIYNTWIVGLGVTVFIIALFTYGFMGVRIMVDRRRFDSTMRAVTSGTAILNHAIKNDAGKMRLFAEKMKSYAIATNQQELLADVETVLHASRHMQEMLQRVHRRTEDLVLKAESVNLAELIERTVASFASTHESIDVQSELSEGWICRLDQAQFSEALGNIIANALEAMQGRGNLLVSLSETKRELIVEVRDNGPGMSKQESAKVLEPFYTTKSGSGMNFGLGLSYAYHVMRKHKGMLQLSSKLGEGTSVYLTLPKRSVQAKRLTTISVEGGEVHEQYSSVDYRG